MKPTIIYKTKVIKKIIIKKIYIHDGKCPKGLHPTSHGCQPQGSG